MHFSVSVAYAFEVSVFRGEFDASDVQTRKGIQYLFQNLGAKLENYRGYSGPIDGVWGKGTEQAFLELVDCFNANKIDISTAEKLGKAIVKLSDDYGNLSVDKIMSCPKGDSSNASREFGYKYTGFLIPTAHQQCWEEEFSSEFCEKGTGRTRKIPIEIKFESIVNNKGEWSEAGKLYITILGKSVKFNSFEMFNRMTNAFTNYDEICPPKDGWIDFWCSMEGRKFAELRFLDEKFELASGTVFTKLWPSPYGHPSPGIKFNLKYAEPAKLNGLAYDNFRALLTHAETFLFNNNFNPSKISALQSALKSAGYYDGVPSGLWNLKTANAAAAAFTENVKSLPNGARVTIKNIEFLMSSKFRETYDQDFKTAETERREAEKQKELQEQAEREKNKRRADMDLERKLAEYRGRQEKEINKNLGFRSIKPGMTSVDVNRECGSNLNSATSVNCYGIDTIGFSGEFEKITLKSATYGGEQSITTFRNLTKLTLDLGPISQSWISYIPTGSTDLNDGDILQKMRNNLSKYKLEYDYSARDVELFNAGEKDKLLTVYESGKVALMVRRVEKEYSSDIKLFLDYRDPETAKKFVEVNLPKRASADDF